MRPIHHFLLPVSLALLAASALADYPDKPVTLIVPFAAGGPTDRVARDFADALHRTLGGQPIVIDNSAGAGGNIGAAKVARAAPDGHTLLLHNIGMATAPALYRSLQFKPLEDFEYLGLVSEVPMTVIGRHDLKAGSLPELRRLITADPGKLTLANAGVGSAAHLCGLLFQDALKAKLVSVPYKGTGPAMSDLLGGQVDLMCDQTTNTSAQIETGKVKAFAVTTTKRLPAPAAIAKLPTLDESGLKGFNVTIWHALYAPKGTPKPVVDKLNGALKAALKDAGFQKREAADGVVVVSDARANPAEHKKFVEAEIAKWTPVIKAAGQYAD